jgi:hypothetical protein
MLTCLAMALSIVSLGDIPALATQVEADARTLSAQTEVTPDFLAKLNAFSEESMQLSDSLRAAGVTEDLPCIFRGISEDSHTRATEMQDATLTEAARADAMTGLHALLSDAILLAPMAGTAAAEAGETASDEQH